MPFSYCRLDAYLIVASSRYVFVSIGAQINERTNQGNGGTALWWAEKKPKANKAAIELLKKHGAVSVAPGFAKRKGGDSNE